MAPIPIHALVAPAHPDWCTLLASLCHQPAPKTGIFDGGYGGTLVSAPFTDSYTYHSGHNGCSVKSVLGLSEGINAVKGGEARKYKGLVKGGGLAPRGESAGEDRGLTWVEGTAVTIANTEDDAEKPASAGGLTKRGETLEAIAWAAAIAGTKYIIKESFKAGGRQIYKAFHEGDTSGLEGTMFEKAPYQPYSWELQESEDRKSQQKAWEVIQREEEAAGARREEASGQLLGKRGEGKGRDEEWLQGKEKREELYLTDIVAELREEELVR